MTGLDLVVFLFCLLALYGLYKADIPGRTERAVAKMIERARK